MADRKRALSPHRRPRRSRSAEIEGEVAATRPANASTQDAGASLSLGVGGRGLVDTTCCDSDDGGEAQVAPAPENVNGSPEPDPHEAPHGEDSAKPAPSASQDPDLPKGFVRKSGKIRRMKGGRDDWLCDDIRLQYLTRDSACASWGRVFAFRDVDGNRHVLPIRAEHFAGDGRDIRAALLNHGFNFSNSRTGWNEMLQLLQSMRTCDRCLSADRFGWVTPNCDSFLLGDGRTLGEQTAIFLGEAPGMTVTEMRPVGALVDWKRDVAAQCEGNPVLVGAVSLALAGPLLEPLGLDSFGLHLRGASSSGKTTALRVAASVWGGPGVLTTWRSTSNGLEGMAALRNSTMLALDELGQATAAEVGEVVYMFANGQGKARARRSGAARPMRTWRAVLLSTGELSLGDRMAEAGRRVAAGQDARLLDLPVEDRTFGVFDHLHGAADGASFSDRLRQATSTANGMAGAAFVDAYMKLGDNAKIDLRNRMASFAAEARRRLPAAIDGQVERTINRFALIAAAGEAATAADITSWSEGEAKRAAYLLLDLWVVNRGGVRSQEEREAVCRVRDFISRHGDARFKDLTTHQRHTNRIVSQMAGWKDSKAFYITRDAWAEIHKGADPGAASRFLNERRLLKSNERGLTWKMASAIKGRPRVYAVSREILGEG